MTIRTADELGITEEEHRALLEFVRRVDTYQITNDGHDRVRMSTSYVKDDCGTVACIGGWVAVIADLGDPVAYVVRAFNLDSPLRRLYWDYNLAFSTKISLSEEAALAARRFLAGDDPWPRRRDAR